MVQGTIVDYMTHMKSIKFAPLGGNNNLSLTKARLLACCVEQLGYEPKLHMDPIIQCLNEQLMHLT